MKHRGLRLALAGALILGALPILALADIVPGNPLQHGGDEIWAQPTPRPAPTAKPRATPRPARTPRPKRAAKPTLTPGFDPELFDAPVPREAYGSRLYILDRVQALEPSEDWAKSASYGYSGLRIPRLFQFDYRKVICFYYGRPKSVATSGCGATSLSMVIAYLRGDTKQSPYTLFRWAINNGLYRGDGLSHDAIEAIAENYGVTGEWVGRDKERVMAAMQAGTPVIAHMGYGRFTQEGHYIVLRGLTEDGLVLVNDPNSLINTTVPFTYEEIVKETKTDEPFYLAYKAESDS